MLRHWGSMSPVWSLLLLLLILSKKSQVWMHINQISCSYLSKPVSFLVVNKVVRWPIPLGCAWGPDINHIMLKTLKRCSMNPWKSSIKSCSWVNFYFCGVCQMMPLKSEGVAQLSFFRLQPSINLHTPVKAFMLSCSGTRCTIPKGWRLG